MLIETKKLIKRYTNAKKILAVNQADIQVDAGETVGLFGESGSGKSTLGLMIAGLEKPTEGEILYRGETISAPYKGERRRKIQILFQHPEISFNPELLLFDSMIEPYEIYGLPYSYKEFLAYLARYGLYEEHLYRTPSQLSGGELQRAALARVLLLKPELIVLDEPTSMLDVITQAQILKLLMDYQREHKTAYLLISHNWMLCQQVCERIYQVDAGKFTGGE